MKTKQMESIDVVYINPTKKEYLVIGTGLPMQVRTVDEFDEWNCINDNEGKPLFDVQVWFDDSIKQEDKNKYYGFQYVNLIPDTSVEDKDYLTQGKNWRNPDKIIITYKLIGEIIIELNNASKVW